MISTPKRRSDPPNARATFPPDRSSPRHARDFVAGRLHDWQQGCANDLAMLLVSELVTNAVIHAGTPADIEIGCSKGSGETSSGSAPTSTVRISVSDGVTTGVDPDAPHGPVPVGAASGRGLHIVDALADRWGVSVGDEGKTVWFELVLADEA